MKHRTGVFVWRYINRLLGRRTLKPKFFLIGAQKSGTTSLFRYLEQHPCVLPPLGKEPHFFDQRIEYGLPYYESGFPLAGAQAPDCERAEPLTGEGSTNYLFDPHTPARVRDYRPDAKLVAILRNPIERAYSHHQHETRRGRESRSFEQAVRDELSWMDEEHERVLADPNYRSERHYRRSYLKRGHYAEQLQRWFGHFPREQFRIYSSDSFFAKPASIHDDVLDFLELPPHRPGQFGRYNVGGYKLKIADSLRVFLEDYYREPNQKLAELLGVDYGW